MKHRPCLSLCPGPITFKLGVWDTGYSALLPKALTPKPTSTIDEKDLLLVLMMIMLIQDGRFCCQIITMFPKFMSLFAKMRIKLKINLILI